MTQKRAADGGKGLEMAESSRERQEKQEREKRGESRERRWRALFLGVSLLLAAEAAVFLFWRFGLRVEPSFRRVTYELGSRVSRDVEDYLTGAAWSVRRGKLDLTLVDEGRPGVYRAAVTHGRDTFRYLISLEDTTPPKIRRQPKEICLALNQTYGPQELIAGVWDASRDVEVQFVWGKERRETVRFARTGRFSCTVEARDSSGNREVLEIPVTVDTPPRIGGVRDIYAALGSQVDYRREVSAWDDRDGDLTGRLKVEQEQVELNREGVYPLVYRVEDDFGLSAVSYARVTVVSPKRLQEMIGSRRISRKTARIVGAVNPYDAGASGEEDLEEALSYIRPALVQLYHQSQEGYSAGSGYIMEIAQDKVFICTNRHVAEINDRWQVYFFDGSRAEGKTLGVSDGYDVGVVEVSAGTLPEGLLESLFTVHIDREYWQGLDEQPIAVGLERIDRQGGVLHVTTGELVKIKQPLLWYDEMAHTEVTVRLEHGDSGSAVIDGHGNFICMAFAYTNAPRRYWCIPLDAVLDSYREITGREVYVY